MKSLPDIKNPIQIYSVQHTGSRFLRKIFLENGFDYVDIKHYTQPYLADQLAVSPIRNPVDVWRSWVSKGRKEDFYQAWRNFNQSFLTNPKLYIIPVDTSERESTLRYFGYVINKTLSTDWEPVGHTEHKEDIPKIDLRPLHELLIIQRFYPALEDST